MNIIVPNGFEANFTLGFVKGLVANDVELIVLSCDLTGPRLTAAAIRNVNIRGSLDEDRSLSEKIVNIVGYYARTMRLLLRHRGGTVHFTGMFDERRILAEILILLLFAKLTARRYLYTVHNVLPHGQSQSNWFRFIYKFIYRLPDALVAHTEQVRRQLVREFGISEEKIFVSSLGLNEEMASTSLTTTEARTRLGLGEAEKVILFLGKIEEYKGPDMLVAAFDALPFDDAHLVVAGSFGDAVFRERLLQQTAKARRSCHIHLYEKFFDNAEAEVYLKAADVLCLPYRNIYQSGLIFLGPRFGVPIVATDVGSLRDFLQEGFGTVTRTNDVAGICAALTEFFSTNPRSPREEIIARSGRFTWEGICKGLLPLYEPASGGDSSSYKINRAVVA